MKPPKIIFSFSIAALLLSITGCGTLTGLPAHGGGKRSLIEQELVSAAVRGALKQIDFTPLRGKTVFIELGMISDAGGGSMTGGKFSLGTLLTLGGMASPVTTTDHQYQGYTTTSSEVNVSTVESVVDTNTTTNGTSTGVSNATTNGSSNNTTNIGGSTNTSSSSSNGTNSSTTSIGGSTNTSSSSSNGTNSSTTNIGASTNTNSNNSQTNPYTTSNTGSVTSNGTNGSTTTTGSTVTTQSGTNGGTTTTSDTTNTGQVNSSGSGTTNIGSSTNTGSGSNSSTSSGTTTIGSSTNTGSGTNASSGSSTTNIGASTNTSSGTNTNTTNATSSGTSAGTAVSNQTGENNTNGTKNTTTDTLNESPIKTTSQKKGNTKSHKVTLSHKGLGNYQNMVVAVSDANFLSRLLHYKLRLSGVNITRDTQKADTVLTVMVDVFGILRTRTDWALHNQEKVRAKTTIEAAAFNRYGKLIMPPRQGSYESVYEESYIAWLGPYVKRKYHQKGTSLMVNYGVKTKK